MTLFWLLAATAINTWRRRARRLRAQARLQRHLLVKGRLSLSSLYHYGNVEGDQRPMEMFELQQVESIQHQLLRRLWRALGRFSGSQHCTSEPTRPKAAQASDKISQSFAEKTVPEKDLHQLVARGALEWARLGRGVSRRQWISSTTHNLAETENCSEESQETKATQASEGRRQGETKLQRQARDCASSMGGQRSVESCASSSSSNSCTIQSRNKIAGACDCDEQEEGHPGPRPSKSGPRGCATAESKCYLTCAACSHGDVKTIFLEARKARANLHASWKQYLDAAIATWKGFLEDFDKEDRKLEEQIELAKTSLATAQEVLQDEADSRGSAWTMEVPNHPPNCCYAAFWRGRSLDVSVSGQWPDGQSGSLLKWTHSILSEPSFLSEWQAVCNGLDLAFDLGSWTGQELPSLMHILCPQLITVLEFAIKSTLRSPFVLKMMICTFSSTTVLA